MSSPDGKLTRWSSPTAPAFATASGSTAKPLFAAFSLSHDTMRHTFTSMFVAKFRSIGEAALSLASVSPSFKG
ncbi:MAG: hypothetical protein JF599_00535 [Verrucomicrobia bacterium]|nr:hypothetical protein [Verrucomicrobiota bacterium]